MMACSSQGWICSMIGAREHYAVPRALQRMGMLRRFYTDMWAGRLMRLGKYGPAVCRSIAARYHADLDNDAVVAFSTATARERLQRSWSAGKRSDEDYRGYLRQGREFANRVNRHIERHWHRDRPNGFFGYHTGSLETLQYFASRGMPTIVDQMDPGRLIQQTLAAESRKWSGWQDAGPCIPDEYYSRIESEWNAASRVVVNSEFSRQALIQQGVPSEKIAIVPLCYEVLPRPTTPKERDRELKVLWLGNVTLLKGIAYLVEAAKLLTGRPIRLTVAGPVAISRDAVAAAPSNMSFVGPVTRDQVDRLYEAADVFVLPTLCDGFAMTQLEAMAHGLPVVVTPNCGRVVTHGVDGVIVPPADGRMLAAALDELIEDRSAVAAMGMQARSTVKNYSLETVASSLRLVIDEVTPLSMGACL